MRRAAFALVMVLAVFTASLTSARAAEWRSQQPDGPGGFPTLLGEVGDIECWRADRCMLTTAGNTGVPAGLFAYDGRGWYRYATVCGGSEGRIAWAGPDEFWTISDQQKGQETGTAPSARVSLCHFSGGQVVASYAEPVGRADSYLPMNAATCVGPSDCWFAGERLPGTANQGAFHLHWDGGSLTAIPALTKSQPEILDPGRAVGGLAYHQGSLYESVLVRGGDAELAAEAEREEPSLLHRVESGGANPFEPLFPAAPIEYGEEGGSARDLGAMHLTSRDGQPLWAIAGAGNARGTVTVLRLGDEDEIVQLPLVDPGAVLGPGAPVGGAAAEANAAWVSFERSTDASLFPKPARLTRIDDDGTVEPEVTLPSAGEEGAGIGRTGAAGPIACSEAEQCWVATEGGWLFHLGPDPAPGADPALRPPPITFRPPDNSLPVVPPITAPVDDSGAEENPPSEQEEVPPEFDPPPRRRPPIVADVRQRLIGGTTLEISFTLRKKARVRLVAKRKRAVVAKTLRRTMARGRRSLRLKLDPERWPTKLDLQVHPLKARSSK